MEKIHFIHIYIILNWLNWNSINYHWSKCFGQPYNKYFFCATTFFPPCLFRGRGVGWGVFLFVSRRKWLHTDEALIHQVQSHHCTALPRCTPSTIKTPKSSFCPEATGAPALVQPHQWHPGSWEADMVQPKFKLIFSVTCKRSGRGEGVLAGLGRTHVSGRHRLLSLLFFSFSPTVVSRAPCRCPISFSRQSDQIPEIIAAHFLWLLILLPFIVRRTQENKLSPWVCASWLPTLHSAAGVRSIHLALFRGPCLSWTSAAVYSGSIAAPAGHHPTTAGEGKHPPHTSFTCCATRQERLRTK